MSNISGMKVLFTGVIAVIIVTVVYGFTVAGSPGSERARRLDSQKTDALNQVSFAIDEWYRVRGSLPTGLEELNLDPYVRKNAMNWIEYSAKEKGDFELCATFAEPTSADDPRMIYKESYPIAVGAVERSFRHEAGRDCFDLRVSYVGKTGQAVAGCQLMVDPPTGKVDCFGCSGANCKTAPAGWVPFEPGGAVGIPYACFDSESGCQLAQ